MPHQLHIVLIEPEIPSNTGAIGRLCLATGSTLHLVDPLGFEINDTQLKRAGLDYWQYLKVVRHTSLDAFFDSLPPNSPLTFFSKKARKSYLKHPYQAGSYLIFGKETKGLSEKLIEDYADLAFRIPIYDERVRSLNLANAVSIVLYEAIRQLGA